MTYLLIMKLRFNVILYSNLGNGNYNAGHIKCPCRPRLAWGPQVPQPCHRKSNKTCFDSYCMNLVFVALVQGRLPFHIYYISIHLDQTGIVCCSLHGAVLWMSGNFVWLSATKVCSPCSFCAHGWFELVPCIPVIAIN